MTVVIRDSTLAHNTSVTTKLSSVKGILSTITVVYFAAVHAARIGQTMIVNNGLNGCSGFTKGGTGVAKEGYHTYL